MANKVPTGLQDYLRDLPSHVIEYLLNLVEDARSIAWIQYLGKDWRDAGKNVRSLRVIVLDVYHERAREIIQRSLWNLMEQDLVHQVLFNLKQEELRTSLLKRDFAIL